MLWTLSASPSRYFPRVSWSARYGKQPDVFNVRVGTGGILGLNAVLQPTEHLGLVLELDRQWLDETVRGKRGRLFTASVARLKATHVFNARTLVRLIGQYVDTRRNPSLYAFAVQKRSGSFAGSALFSYKLNWQTVLFLGYGDNRALDDSGAPVRTSRQAFLKVSYALQE